MRKIYQLGFFLLEKGHYIAAVLAVVLVFFSLKFIQLEDQLFQQAMDNQRLIRGHLKMTLLVHRGAAISLKGLQPSNEGLFFEGLDLLESAVNFSKNFHPHHQLQLDQETQTT